MASLPAKSPVLLATNGLWFPWGQQDTDFTSCRLTHQDIIGQDGEFRKPVEEPPKLKLVYEEIPATAEVQVGNPDVVVNQYSYKEVTIESVQFSAGTAFFFVPGVTAAPAPYQYCLLRDQTFTDDGTLRTYKRTYVEGGLLSDTEELKFGGKLVLRTLRSLIVPPSNPSGYTPVTESVDFINGLQVWSMGYASAAGSIGLGGEISQKIDYNISPDQGTTGVTVTTIKWASDLSVTSNPITGPVGSELISVDFADEAGFRMWTAVYASGQGLIDSGVDIKEGGRLIVYSKRSINAAPIAPTATIGGTVALIQSNVRNGTDATNGTVVYDYQWAEGIGEISRGFTNSQGGPADFDPENPTASTGPIVCTIRQLTSLSVSEDPTLRPAGFVRIASSYEDSAGYRIWTVRYGYGAGMTVDDVEYKNLGKLKIYHRVALGAPPPTPQAASQGSVDNVVLVDGGSGYSTAPAVSFTGGGGTGASAEASLAATTVASLSLTNAGSGYRSAPVVSLTGGGGSGALASAVLTPTTVSSLALTNGGSGYTSTPTVSLTGGGGTGATATCVLSGRAVASVTITNGGSGYTGAPTIAFSGGGGTGAAATAVLTPTSVASIAISAGGSGYTSAPTVAITGGGGTGATGTAALTPTTLDSVSISAGGSGYTSVPTIGFSGGGGSGAAATANLISSQTVAAVAITHGGSYTPSFPGTVSFSGGGGTGAAGTNVLATTGVVKTLTGWSGGVGYNTSAPTIGFSGGGGSGAAATATLTGDIGGVLLVSGGSGYGANFYASISGGGGSGAQILCITSGGAIVGFIVELAGTGFTSAPTLSFASGGGTGASATVSLANGVRRVLINLSGSGYSGDATLTFSGGGGSGAAGFAKMSGGNLLYAYLTNPGSGYTSVPTVGFTGGGGSGATATAVIKTGTILNYTVTNQGSGYTSNPTLTWTGGDGTGASGGQANVYYEVASVTITNPGSGYTSAPTVTFSTVAFGDPATGTALLGQSVGSATVTNPGSNYSSAPSVSFSGGGGSGASATAVLSATSVLSLTLSNGGSGFTSTPSVGLTGGGGTGATGTASLTGTTVASATVTISGSNYSSAPTVSFSGGGGTGAAATSVLGSTASIASLTLTAPGSGYTSSPTVGFVGGAGTGATGSATLTGTTLASISLDAPGSDYTGAPAVAFFGGSGSGAAATSALTPSSIEAIVILAGGSGYTSAPSVGFSFGTATAYAEITDDPGTVNLISARERHEDGYDLFDYTWAEGVGVVDERIAMREGGLRLESWTSFGLQAGTGVFTPAGIPITIDTELMDGFTKYVVTCMQNSAGGDPLTGTALIFDDYQNFTYPGRAKIYSMTFSLWSSGTGYVYDVFKSPPIQVQVEATVEISYQTSDAIGALTYPLWNPTSWATLRANWQGLDAYAKAEVSTLYGYMTVGTATLAYTAPAYPSSVSILGINALQNSSGQINLSGGPTDPGGSNVTLLAKLEPAFVDFYGTQYYRKTIVWAAIPTFPALPV